MVRLETAKRALAAHLPLLDMDEASWARSTRVEPLSCDASAKTSTTRSEQFRLWARRTSIRKEPVFCLGLVVACGIMMASVLTTEHDRFQVVLKRALELKALDTSHNSIQNWLHGSKSQHPAHPRRARSEPLRSVMPGPGMSTNGFQWTSPAGQAPPARYKRGRSAKSEPPRGEMLRLPIGVATALMRQRLQREVKQGVDFQRNIDWGLLRTLEQQVQDVVLLPTSSQHTLAHLQKLLKWARDGEVVTEVGPLTTRVVVKGHSLQCKEDYMRDDPQCLSETILRQQLRRFEGNPLLYSDIMTYPFLADKILYRGTFRELKFEGQGVMYYRNGQAAYQGAWHLGSMNGPGILFDEDGSILFKGEFQKGVPRHNALASLQALFQWPARAARANRGEGAGNAVASALATSSGDTERESGRGTSLMRRHGVFTTRDSLLNR